MSDIGTEPLAVLQVTDAARTMVLDLRSDEQDGETLALWVEVSGTSGSSYSYDMYFQAVGEVSKVDWSAEDGGLTVVVRAGSVNKIRGSVLDVDTTGGQVGLVLQNPNQPPRPSGPSPAMTGPPPDLSGNVAERVTQVLEYQVNPSIAAHGGRADLVAVEDDTAYLRLSGGCAGCGMASVTLSQGIEVMIRESVTEITKVVDVTDHASGANPYYEPAKK
jgi:Fe/S biogenesis protein NfuA